jgi:hypothetical protein
MAVEEKDSLSDSDEDPQPEFGGAIVVKSQNRLSVSSAACLKWE